MSNTKRLFAAIVCLLFLVPGSRAQFKAVKKLDSLFNTLDHHGMATGSIAISIDGKMVYRKAMGFSMFEGDMKIAPAIDTRYRIGSVSKMFTAVMIFQLMEEGKLRPDQRLAAWFPQLPNAAKITIEDMLRHRSGLHDYTEETNFTDWMDKPVTHEQILKIVQEKGADFEPRTRTDYCNTNFLLLGYIVEAICKMPYADAMQVRIVSKAGLNSTYCGKPVDSKGRESASYKYADSTWHPEKQTDMSIHGGAGSIVSTPADLVIFIEKLFAGQLISAASLGKMKTITEGYGMGMFPYDFRAIEGYGHNGRIEEFYSAVRYFPSKKMAIAYVVNGILYPRNDILDAVLKICFDEQVAIPFSNTAALLRFNASEYTGEYAGDLPFTVICKKGNNALIFEAGGRTMEAVPISEHYFMNAKMGYFYEFDPRKGELRIKETDNLYYLRKK